MLLGDTINTVNRITYKNWTFHIGVDRGNMWLQVRFPCKDCVTGAPRNEHGRKWLLSDHMTRSEIVATAFKAVLTAEEHEVREHFRYLDRAVYGPHIDVDHLWHASVSVDVRR